MHKDITDEVEIKEVYDKDALEHAYFDIRPQRLGKLNFDVRRANSGNRIIYVVYYKDEPVGTWQLVFETKDDMADGENRAHLNHGYVVDSFRGQGIGTKFFERSEYDARKRGFQELTLTVLESNRRAIALYERVGYEECRRRTGKKGNPVIDMKKSL